jgi:hypothetical protein
MDAIATSKQVIYWVNVVTGEGGRRRRNFQAAYCHQSNNSQIDNNDDDCLVFILKIGILDIYVIFYSEFRPQTRFLISVIDDNKL